MDAAICVQTDSAINACERHAGLDSYLQQAAKTDIGRGAAPVVLVYPRLDVKRERSGGIAVRRGVISRWGIAKVPIRGNG